MEHTMTDHTPTHRLTIGYDSDTEDPNNYSPFKFVSFSDRHINFMDRDILHTAAECPSCDGTGETDLFGALSFAVQCSTCFGTGETITPNPDILATLSYYEHGAHRWMVGESVVPDHGGFDTVNFAGAILWDADNDESEGSRGWWDGLDIDGKHAALVGAAEEYTLWSNGENFYYSLESLYTCPTCNHVDTDGGEVDSCGGFIGVDALMEELRPALEAAGITSDEHLEVVGDAAYLANYHDLFKDETAEVPA